MKKNLPISQNKKNSTMYLYFIFYSLWKISVENYHFNFLFYVSIMQWVPVWPHRNRELSPTWSVHLWWSNPKAEHRAMWNLLKFCTLDDQSKDHHSLLLIQISIFVLKIGTNIEFWFTFFMSFTVFEIN